MSINHKNMICENLNEKNNIWKIRKYIYNEVIKDLSKLIGKYIKS